MCRGWWPWSSSELVASAVELPKTRGNTDEEGEKETTSSLARRKEVEMARFVKLNTVVRGASAAVLRTL